MDITEKWNAFFLTIFNTKHIGQISVSELTFSGKKTEDLEVQS